MNLNIFLVGDFNLIPFSLLYNVLLNGTANFKNSPIKEYSGQTLATKLKSENIFESLHFLTLTKVHRVDPATKKPALNDEFLVKILFFF